MQSPRLIDVIETEDSANPWLVTFADMMTLLLVFFVLLYTLSDFEDKAYRSLIGSIQIFDGEGNQASIIDYAQRSGRNPEPLQLVEDLLGLNPSNQIIDRIKPALVTELEQLFESMDMAHGTELRFTADQINLQIDGRFLFPSGSAKLENEAKVIFANLSHVLHQYSNYRIAIRGHTDDLVIKTAQFPSNWELSAIRATTVLRYFIRQGVSPERMTATGYADFLPLVENDTVENRARNRRVEIVLEKEKMQ